MRFRAIVSFFLLFAMVAATLPAQKRQISDDTIYDQVKRRLANDMDIKGGGLQVDVKQGVVTIRGTVETEKQKTKATKVVKKVKGVEKVNNDLTVTVKGAR